MFKNLVTKVFGDPNEKQVKRIGPVVEKINAFEAEFERMSDADLAAETEAFRERIAEAVGTLKEDLAEARMILAYYRLGQTEDARRSMRRSPISSARSTTSCPRCSSPQS